MKVKYNRHIAKKCDNWVRVEAQIKGKYAHQLTNIIKECCDDVQFKNLILSSILDRYMFFYTETQEVHKITMLMLELLDEKNFSFKSVDSKNNVLERTIEYLKESSGLYPTLYKICDIWGEEEIYDFFNYIINDFKKNFNPNSDHITWLNKYKSLYIKEKPPWKDDYMQE